MDRVAEKRHIYIRDRKTKQVEHAIETDKTGRLLEKVLDGLYNRIDFDRFYVDSSEVDPLLQK